LYYFVILSHATRYSHIVKENGSKEYAGRTEGNTIQERSKATAERHIKKRYYHPPNKRVRPRDRQSLAVFQAAITTID